MTLDLEEARLEALDDLKRFHVVYIYRLRTGHYYISPTPPACLTCEFVERVPG